MSVWLRHSGYSLSTIAHNEHNQLKGWGVESQVVSLEKKKKRQHSAASC